MPGPGYVTPHALDRFGEHHAYVTVGHFLGIWEDSRPISPEVARWILARPEDGREGNAYRLTRDGKGIFVLAESTNTTSPFRFSFATYVRLRGISQDRAADLFPDVVGEHLPIPGTTYSGPHGRLATIERVTPATVKGKNSDGSLATEDGRVYFRTDDGLRSLSLRAFAERYHRFYKEG